MTTFGICLLTLNAEKGVAGDVKGVKAAIALAEGNGLEKVRVTDGLEGNVPVLDSLSDGVLPEFWETVVDVEKDSRVLVETESVDVGMFVVLETETRVGGTLLHGRLGKEEQGFADGDGVRGRMGSRNVIATNGTVTFLKNFGRMGGVSVRSDVIVVGVVDADFEVADVAAHHVDFAFGKGAGLTFA